MSPTIHPVAIRRPASRLRLLVLLVSASTLVAACGDPGTTQSAGLVGAPADQGQGDHGNHGGHDSPPGQPSAAMLANARYQDVEVAEAHGYASSVGTLGCFQNPEHGGMGVHYINEALLDTHVDVREPEALVYEMDADGHITGLVAHEYIVPIDAWTAAKPPSLFGMNFHRHPTLPFWVLHAWLWKPNPDGMFADWNPAVRLCPSGVPIFGVDLPAPPPATGPTA